MSFLNHCYVLISLFSPQFQDELGVSEHDEEGHEEETLTQNVAKFNIPQAIRYSTLHLLTCSVHTCIQQGQ